MDITASGTTPAEQALPHFPLALTTARQL